MHKSMLHFSFDFDYTLADSSEGVILCFNYALKELGYRKQPDEIIRKSIGLSLRDALKSFDLSIDEQELKEFENLFKEKADKVMLDMIQLYSEVEPVFIKLKNSGHYISIVSTKYKYRIEAVLQRDNIFHLVDNIIGGDNVTNHKPDPEGLNRAVKESKISKNKTIYIGDSVSDGECAKRAQVKFIAVKTGVTDLNLLQNLSPSKFISNLEELVEYNA